MINRLDRPEIRQIGHLTIKRDDRLKYTHYAKRDPLTADCVEVYIADELRKGGMAFRKVKHLLNSEINRVKDDPFGETSIDPDRGDKRIRRSRAVNRLQIGIEEQVGLPIAIKSADRSDLDIDSSLVDQFLVMRELQILSGERLGPLGKVIGFLPVYGAIREGKDEYLIMQYIRGGRMEDQEVPYRSFGWSGSGDPSTELAIVVAKYQDFLAVLGINPLGEEHFRWRSITPVLETLIGRPLNDLAGRNVLIQGEDHQRKFVIIDQIRGNID